MRGGSARLQAEDDDIAYWEAAERLAKKRVAFRDDLLREPPAAARTTPADDYRAAAGTHSPPPSPGRLSPTRARRPGMAGMRGTFH